MSTDAKKSPRPVKNVPMPDIYNEEDAVEETTEESSDESSPGIEVSEGFNPYDTGSLYKK